MRLAFIVIAVLLASCGGRDSQVSRITGEWRAGVSPTSNVVDLTLNQDGKTVTGFSDVNNVAYDLKGRWEGSFGPDEVLNLDMTLSVMNLSIKGDGTLSTGGEEGDITVVGRRAGRSFQMSVNPEAGEALQISGHISYDFRDFKLDVEIENIPAGLQGGEPRDLHLVIEGTAKGGFWNLLPSATGSDT